MADVHTKCADVGRHVCKTPTRRPWVHPAVEQRDHALARIDRARAMLVDELREAVWDMHITSLERVRDALADNAVP
ncbi:hypothetical protein [Amycolatopsis echigonensis]|uniref:Uncharacterized protein n=1 Tax=Amycolatopsis echigonensis TaxID=2576905 RepID=A0A8E1W8U6_9PSEU|nr:hypothetical protein [Amycolatopsis echigonensis]MBB2506016.1 hypothetical protein [Amycolatopsis echigonensis]